MSDGRPITFGWQRLFSLKTHSFQFQPFDLR